MEKRTSKLKTRKFKLKAVGVAENIFKLKGLSEINLITLKLISLVKPVI